MQIGSTLALHSGVIKDTLFGQILPVNITRLIFFNLDRKDVIMSERDKLARIEKKKRLNVYFGIFLSTLRLTQAPLFVFITLNTNVSVKFFDICLTSFRPPQKEQHQKIAAPPT